MSFKNKKADELMDDEKIKNEVQDQDNLNCNENNESEEGSTGVSNDELMYLKEELDQKNKKCEEYMSMLQRTAAEFDNYKKRTIKEREVLYTDAVADTVTSFLSVADNMERALDACSKEGDVSSLREGVELTFRQLKEVFNKLGVEDIKAVGEKFDPNIHNAVMHVEDEAYGENEVIEEFQKGYKVRDKVVRYSMVKVAN